VIKLLSSILLGPFTKMKKHLLLLLFLGMDLAFVNVKKGAKKTQFSNLWGRELCSNRRKSKLMCSQSKYQCKNISEFISVEFSLLLSLYALTTYSAL